MQKLEMKIVLVIGMCLLLTACNATENGEDFVTARDGQFYCNEEPYRYVGTNFWYGAILGSEGQGGNRERLSAELDSLHALGLDNLRILVGADGATPKPSLVWPTLQTAPGVYNDTLFAGLDWLLQEMCDNIVTNDSIGIYDGAYRVVEAAMGLREED